MTKETARFLLDLLDAQTLSVGAPDFPEVVERVLAARAELVTLLDPDATRSP